MPRKKEISKAARIADAVGVGHLLLGTIIIFLGEVSEVFGSFGYEHGGVLFVFRYLCAPVYFVVGPYMPGFGDSLSILISGFLIVVGGSVFYGILTYAVIRLVCSALGIKKF